MTFNIEHSNSKTKFAGIFHPSYAILQQVGSAAFHRIDRGDFDAESPG
jgi:hypothetical protein